MLDVPRREFITLIGGAAGRSPPRQKARAVFQINYLPLAGSGQALAARTLTPLQTRRVPTPRLQGEVKCSRQGRNQNIG